MLVFRLAYPHSFSIASPRFNCAHHTPYAATASLMECRTYTVSINIAPPPRKRYKYKNGRAADFAPLKPFLPTFSFSFSQTPYRVNSTQDGLRRQLEKVLLLPARALRRLYPLAPAVRLFRRPRRVDVLGYHQEWYVSFDRSPICQRHADFHLPLKVLISTRITELLPRP